MLKIYTLEELVMNYGTEIQQESFRENGNLNRRSFDSVIKVVEQTWGSVLVEGRGSKRIIKCGEKLEVKILKKDGRLRSGRFQVQHRIPMDIIVAAHLEANIIDSASMSLSRWAVKFGLITDFEADLLRSRNAFNMRQYHYDLMTSMKLIDEDQYKVLDDFTIQCLAIYKELAKTLEHMKKCGIILFFENWKANCKGQIIQLSPETVKKIYSSKRILMEKHNVSEFNIIAHRNARKVIAFNQEWKNKLNRIQDERGEILGINVYWKEYGVILKASKNAVKKYMETYCKYELQNYLDCKENFLKQNEENFVSKRKQHFLQKAEKVHHKKKMEYLSQKITFESDEEEENIRLFYTDKELDDLVAGYDIGMKRLHMQSLYVKCIEELFDLYNLRSDRVSL